MPGEGILIKTTKTKQNKSKKTKKTNRCEWKVEGMESQKADLKDTTTKGVLRETT